MLPEHLKIGYEVVRVSTGTKDFELQGEFDAAHGTIIVNAEGTPRRRLAILMHEILHACVDQAELSDKMDDALEEQVVNRLSTILTAVLLDNPQLRQCIDEAAGAANGTCYKLPAMTVENLTHVIKELDKNKPIVHRGSEQRSEQLCHGGLRLTECPAPHCHCWPFT